MKKTILLFCILLVLIIPISFAARYALTVPNYGSFGSMFGVGNCPVNSYCHAINLNVTTAYLNYSMIPAGTILWYEVD
jgi:hypothetical protein